MARWTHRFLPSFLVFVFVLVSTAAARADGPTPAVSIPPLPVLPATPAAPDAPAGVAPPQGGTTWSVEGWPEVTAAANTIARVLARNQISWGGLSGPVAGFRPGASYDRIFARDTSTILPAARYFYGDAYLRSAVEEFLATQFEAGDNPSGYPGPGSTSATVSWDNHFDKATVTSDEETSLIHAAYLYYRTAGGTTWLKRNIRGRTVAARLSAAMDSLLVARLDPATGLIRRGATTDWGDVKMEGGAHPTDMEPGDAWVASSYDQALAFRALNELSEMFGALGDSARSDRYGGFARQIRAQSNNLLWQPDRGYYRVRIGLSPAFLSADEDGIVGIGNAIAIYAGLPDPEQAGSILAALERARLESGSAKPGVSLWPAYPLGLFKHPSMAPGSYQNGGVWDWWGGIQVSAEFASGYSGLARRHLAAIVADWQAHSGRVGEWQWLGSDRLDGSADYSGAAATVGEAILEGLFGLRLTADTFTLQPRLGDLSGAARAAEQATGFYLTVEQRATRNAVQVIYATNHKNAGAGSILLPDGLTPVAVTLDGAPADYTLTPGGADWYVVLPRLPTGAHRIAIQLQ
jgi:hypothetical protein